MDTFTPFPFRGRDYSVQAIPNHFQHSFACSLDSREDATALARELVLLAWVKLIHAYTGQTDIRFAYAKTEQDESLQYSSPHIQLFPTISATQVLAAFRAAVELDPANLSTAPSLLIEDHSSPSNGRQRLLLAPLQVRFCVHTQASPCFEFEFEAAFDHRALSTFHVEGMLRYLDFYIQILAQGDSIQSLLQMPQLTTKDNKQIAQWNATPPDKVLDTIHNRISSIASQHSSHPAVDAWDGSFTFGELDSTADKLARFLSEHGIKNGDTVSICMEKSIYVPVSMLAVLKTGAAFILFDADLPFKRLETMKRVADCRYSITSPGNVGLASRLHQSVIVIDDEGEWDVVETNISKPQLNEPPRQPFSVHDTAFLIFTSGSSGEPKAVEIQHYAWCSTYTGHQQTFGISSKTRVLQLSSPNFVLSCLEILSTLMVGGTVCIPSVHEQRNDIAGAIRRLKPDWVSMTPSLARIYQPEDFPSVETLVLVGEMVLAAIVRRWTSSQKVTLLNGYGQSEACSMNSTTPLTGHSPVGRNIGHSSWVRYWVVDPFDHNRLAPVGAVGELLVEGHAIAKGYRNNVEKTKEAFIETPLWAPAFRAGQDGQRFYKTGDLVQYQEIGDLHLFGRKDTQLKVRGQRMEATEVEHHIMNHFREEVRQAVIEKTTSSHNPDVEQLTAFLVLHDATMKVLAHKNDSAESSEDQTLHSYLSALLERIVNYLSTLLPSWMVPTSIRLLKSAPTTATGKLSRRLLGEQQVLCSVAHAAQVDKQIGFTTGFQHTTATDDAKDKTAANSSIQALAGIWSRILNVPVSEIHPDHKWSDWGGDSLSAMSFVYEARKLGFRSAFADVYSGRSIAEIAGSQPPEERPPPTNGATSAVMQHWEHPSVNNHFSMTDFQEYCILTGRRSPPGLIYTYKIRFRGQFSMIRLRRAVENVILNTDALRLHFAADEANGTMQSVGPYTPETQLAAIQLSNERGSSEHDSSPFNRPVLFNITRDEQSSELQLIVRLHHAVFDGTSVKMLLEDLASAYIRDSSPDPRPSFTMYLTKRLLRKEPAELGYWKNLLQCSSPTLLRVPVTKLFSGSGPTADYSFVRVIDLGSHILPAGITVSTILKAGWAIVLSCMAKTTDIVFEYLVHGRDEDTPDSQRVIGCCVSNVPCRVKIEDTTSSERLLSSVGRQVMESIPYAHVGSPTIARECTDWGFNGRVCYHSSWLLHQNIEVVKHLEVGDAGYMDVPEPHFRGGLVGDWGIITTPYGNQAIKVLLRTHKALYTPKEVFAVWRAFSICIRGLLAKHSVDGLRRQVDALGELPRKYSS